VVLCHGCWMQTSYIIYVRQYHSLSI
jgi:hypothetical protein